MTGTEVLVIVASQAGRIYTYGTPRLQPLVQLPGSALLTDSISPTPIRFFILLLFSILGVAISPRVPHMQDSRFYG